MELLILALILVGSIFLIPLGLPGTWVMVAAAVGYSYLVPDSIGWFTIVAIALLAVVGEVLEFTISGRYARKYGGSRRAEWGAILGGMVGAFMGVPVPVIGSVIGAFVGAFVGAFLFEYGRAGDARGSTRVATGALIGRVVAAAIKVGIGVAIAAWALLSAWL
ncbi:MAG: DUF456 family protein [Gemmatimonadaceae bacterium]